MDRAIKNTSYKTLDHPILRSQRECPLCSNRKAVGLVCCWTCYRNFDLRNGNPEANILLDKAEQNQEHLQRLIKQ